MNKNIFIVVAILAFTLIVSGITGCQPTTEENKSEIGLCIVAGQSCGDPSLGPDFYTPGKCCSGLVEISGVSEDSYTQAPDGKYYPPIGGTGVICSDCGNGICEEWEHKYNCPEDCEKECVGENGEFHVMEEKKCCEGLTEILTSKSTVACTYCGNGICKDPEDASNCPVDCFIEPQPIWLNETQFITENCIVSGTVGGPVTYGLRITLIDSLRMAETSNTISFSIQDPNNNASNLLIVGSHSAIGGTISNRLQPSGFSWIVTQDEMEIVWEEINVTNHKFNGKGYIYIKKPISEPCPDKMWVGGHYAVKGDPDYVCNFGNYYYPEQKISFECQDGISNF